MGRQAGPVRQPAGGDVREELAMNKSKVRSRTAGTPATSRKAAPKIIPAGGDGAKPKAPKESPAAEAAHVDLRTELYRGS